MDEKKIRNTSYFLVFSCSFVFLLSIALKKVYVSALITIQAEYGMSAMETRIGTLLYYCVYAVSQVLLGIFFKKINVKKVFFISAILSAITYSITVFCTAPWQLWIIQCVNGVIQAPLWSGCIYFVGKFIKNRYLSVTNTILAFANPMGQAVASGIVALFAFLKLWKVSFAVLGVLMIGAAFMFKIAELKSEKCLGEIQNKQTPAQEQVAATVVDKKSYKHLYLLFTFIVFFVAFIAALQSGVLEVSSQLITELLFKVYKLPDSISILVPIVVPFIKTGMVLVVYQIYYRLKNLFMVSFGLCVACCVLSVLMYFFASVNLVCAIIIPTLLSATAHALTAMLGTQFSLATRKKYNSGSSSAINNGVACAFTGIMPFVSGAILDVGGDAAWTGNYILVMAICAVSTLMVLSLLLTKKKNPLFIDDELTAKAGKIKTI